MSTHPAAPAVPGAPAGTATATTPDQPPTAASTDPVTLGWMTGSPPPAERLVRREDQSHMRFPQTRWSFAHFRQLVPSAQVWRGDAGASTLPRAERSDIDAVRFTPLGAAAPMTWAESLQANFTDAIVVLHRGRILHERYFGVMKPHVAHMCMSVTKSLVGTLGAMLAHGGALSESQRITHYIPELAGTAYDGATVRQVMDMTIGVRYSEDYANPEADIWRFLRAGGLHVRPAGDSGPSTLYEYLRTLVPEGRHGEGFIYKTVNTEVLGWLIRRVTQRNIQDLLSEWIWQPIGAEEDAYIQVDSESTAFAGGGLNACVRDLARFGEAMRCDGAFNGRQIVPAAVVHDIRQGASTADFARAGYALLPGWSYRHMWWITHNPHGAFTARGIHGQAIYVDPKAEMTIARFASHPMAANAHLDPTSLPAYQALAEHLIRSA